MKRRTFLKTSFGTLPSLWFWSHFPQSILRAAPKDENHFFISLFLTGGWDVTLLTDPWLKESLPDSKDLFIEYNRSSLVGTSDFLLGPSGAPLIPFVDRMAIINGLFVGQSDNGHDAHEHYVRRGTSVGTSPDVPILLADAGSPVPFGVMVAGGTNLSRASSAQPITQLKSMASLLFAAPDDTELDPNPPSSAVESSKLLIQKYRQTLDLAGADVTRYQSEISDPVIGGVLPLELATIAAFFNRGLSRTAAMTLIDGSLDTHGNHARLHAETLMKTMKSLATILRFFQKIPFGNSGESLFDRTTFLVSSEFSRSPRLNGSGGKDHNPHTNSAILIGRGVRGRQIVGASQLITGLESPTGFSDHIAAGFDFRTQSVMTRRTPDARVILPENLTVTLEKIFHIPKSWSNLQIQGEQPLSRIIL